MGTRLLDRLLLDRVHAAMAADKELAVLMAAGRLRYGVWEEWPMPSSLGRRPAGRAQEQHRESKGKA